MSQLKSPSSKTVTTWRPTQTIAVKVIGLALHNACILAFEVYDDSGTIKGVRPLGGHIEFGETRETALQREFLEELDTRINIIGAWHTFENIYSHEGAVGHEFLHGARIDLLDASLYDQERIVFCEDSGDECIARWFSIEECKRGNLALFPPKLLDIL